LHVFRNAYRSRLACFTATLVLVFRCWNPSRCDSLVGYGRVLSLISLAALLILLSMTFLGSSLSG
jgi:hypothetical protein